MEGEGDCHRLVCPLLDTPSLSPPEEEETWKDEVQRVRVCVGGEGGRGEGACVCVCGPLHSPLARFGISPPPSPTMLMDAADAPVKLCRHMGPVVSGHNTEQTLTEGMASEEQKQRGSDGMKGH